MTDVERSKITERVRKLLALAANNPSETEAALAAQRASDLLLAHDLSMADVSDAPEREGIEIEATCEGRSVPEWKVLLAGSVAQHYLCEALIFRGQGIHFVGRSSDLAVAVHLFVFLQRAIERLAEEGLAQYRAEGGAEHGRRWKNGFRHGAVARLHLILHEKRHQQETAQEAVTALVRTSKEEVRRHIAANYSLGGEYRTRGTASAVGYGAGRAAADGIALNDAISGGDRASLG